MGRKPSTRAVDPVQHEGGLDMKLHRALRKHGLSLICAVFLVLILPRSGVLHAAEYQVIVLAAPAPLTDSEGQGVGAGQAVGTGRIPGSVYPNETHAVV